MTEAYTGVENLEVMREAVNYNRFLVNLILQHTQPTDVVLDFGAGAGTFATKIHASGRNVVCLEPDLALSGHLARLGFTVFTDLASIPDNTIDCIYTLNVLEHISDDQAAVEMLYRKLNPNGLLLVYVPAFQALFSSMDRKVGHFRRYRRKGLEAILQKAQFEIVKLEYVDSLGFLAALVFKWFDKGGGDINVNLLKLYDRLAFPLSRILDRIFYAVGGKNVYAVAVKNSV